MNSKKSIVNKKNIIELNKKTEKVQKITNNVVKNKGDNSQRNSFIVPEKKIAKMKRNMTDNLNDKKPKRLSKLSKNKNTKKNDDISLNDEKESKSSYFKSSFVSSCSSKESGSKFLETIKLISEIQKNFEESVKANNNEPEEIKKLVKLSIDINDYIPLSEEEKTNLENDIIKSSDLRIQNYKTAFSYIDTALNKIKNALDAMDVIEITEESSSFVERKSKNSYKNIDQKKNNNKIGEYSFNSKHVDYINSDDFEFESESYSNLRIKKKEIPAKKIYLSKNMAKKAASIENNSIKKKMNIDKNNYKFYSNRNKNNNNKSKTNNSKTSLNYVNSPLRTSLNTSKSNQKDENISSFKRRVSYSPPPVQLKKKGGKLNK